MSCCSSVKSLLGLPVLLAGTLPLRYCAARFPCGVPTWRLPVSGYAASLVADLWVAESGGAEVASREVRHVGHSVVSYADCKRRRYDQHDGVMFLFMTGPGWMIPGTSPGLHAWNSQVAECTRDVEWIFTHIH